jgi:formamidopyrimidine-DNA glycosylase
MQALRLSLRARSAHRRPDAGQSASGQRRYADNETNYCARCQTSGRLLADRALSRLLGADWPRTLDELEALKRL